MRNVLSKYKERLISCLNKLKDDLDNEEVDEEHQLVSNTLNITWILETLNP